MDFRRRGIPFRGFSAALSAGKIKNHEEKGLILEKLLLPKRMCGAFYDVTPEFLASQGIRNLLCDIDNTLVTYDDPAPTPEVLDWLRGMEQGGVSVGFVSNNDEERVRRFNDALGLPACAKAGKPNVGKLKRVMAEMGATAGETAFLGDQLLTDAAAANRAGLYSIVVPPIRDKKTAFFRFKRLLEVPYVRKYRKMNPETSCADGDDGKQRRNSTEI